MSGFGYPTTRTMNQTWLAEFDDWNGDGRVDYPGGFYHSIGWDGHNGLDFLTPVGDPVYASNSGTVEFAGAAGSHWLLSGGGNVVMLKHPEFRVRTEYLHLSTVIVKPGQLVGKGQLLGYAGKSGAATGAHLHFGFIPMEGVNINNRMRGRISPWPYLTGGISAAGIITKLQELTVALELKDLEAIQGIVQSERTTIVNEIREGNKAVIDFIEKKVESSEWDTKVFVQMVDNDNTDRSIVDNRAQEESTRAELNK
jgi:murein DD-endopeptidase MepM/ murein hydrolase activator NlpD